MKRLVIATLMMAIGFSFKAEASEIYKAQATAYCLTGTTATGTQTTENHTVASKPEWFGCTMIMWLDDGDGIIRPQNYIGTYTVEDTGSEPIRKGRVVDVYISDYDSAIKFGRKKILFQIVESEG